MSKATGIYAEIKAGNRTPLIKTGTILEGRSPSNRGLRIEILQDFTPSKGGPPPAFRLIHPGYGAYSLQLQRAKAEGHFEGLTTASKLLTIANKLGADKMTHGFNINLLHECLNAPAMQDKATQPAAPRKTIRRKKQA